MVVVSLSFRDEEQKGIYTVWYIQGQREPRDVDQCLFLLFLERSDFHPS